MLNLSRLVLLALGIALAAPLTALAAYPEKPVKIIVPFGAGGSSDMSARLIAKAIEKDKGVSIAVVNIAGGGTAPGNLEASRARPDGYTLLWQHKTLITAHHTGVSALNWDAFTPICNVLLFNEVLHVHKDNAAISTMPALLEKAKENPESLRFPVQIGAGAHFGALAVEKAGGVTFHIIASGGDMDRLNEQLGRRVDVVFQSIPPTLPHIEAGTIIPIAVGAEERDPKLPDVPTFRELGYDIITTFNLGLYGPKGLPEDIVRWWEEAVRQVLADTDLQAELAKQSLYPAYRESQAFAAMLQHLDKELYDLAKVGGLLPQ